MGKGASESEQQSLQDVILIEPTNPKATVSFNLLEQTKDVFPEEQAEELAGVFRKIWSDAWGYRMADILRNSLIALVESNLTLVELPLLLTNRLTRKGILSKVKNPHCLQLFNFFDSLRLNT